ncbi:MAG: FliM/FliN family flagellar motor switch protein [Pseudomonadota bacterium]
MSDNTDTSGGDQAGPGTAAAAGPAGGDGTGGRSIPDLSDLDGPPPSSDAGENAYRRAIFSVPIDVVVAVGQAQPVIGELLAMRRDTVLPLSSRVDDPVQIMVGDRVIARGELEELGDDGARLGVRLTEVVDVTELF